MASNENLEVVTTELPDYKKESELKSSKLEMMVKEVETLKKQMAVANDHNASLENDLQALRAENKQLVEKANLLETKNKNFLDYKHEAHRSLEYNEKMIAEQKEAYAALVEEKNDLFEKVSQLEIANSGLTGSVEYADLMKNDAVHQLEVLKTNVRGLAMMVDLMGGTNHAQ